MKTNELKKGDRVILRSGRYGTMEDNKKGNTRMVTVEGFYTEMGSIYAHDITHFIDSTSALIKIEHTPAQLKLKKQLESMGW